jgi:hypothetical protein
MSTALSGHSSSAPFERRRAAMDGSVPSGPTGAPKTGAYLMPRWPSCIESLSERVSSLSRRDDSGVTLTENLFYGVGPAIRSIPIFVSTSIHVGSVAPPAFAMRLLARFQPVSCRAAARNWYRSR